MGDLDLPELRQRWRKLTRQEAPAHLSRYILIGMLAYRIQATAYGDLDGETARYLQSVAREVLGGNARPVQPVGDGRVGRLKPGTTLVREHEGQLHRVMVMTEGYAWNGTTYDSLSAVARAITGTNWNGPRFFGLRDRAGERQASNRAAVGSTVPPARKTTAGRQHKPLANAASAAPTAPKALSRRERKPADRFGPTDLAARP